MRRDVPAMSDMTVPSIATRESVHVFHAGGLRRASPEVGNSSAGLLSGCSKSSASAIGRNGVNGAVQLSTSLRKNDGWGNGRASRSMMRTNVPGMTAP